MKDFTTFVAIDDGHVDEFSVAWPTWEKHRPEILERPLVLICDGSRPTKHWVDRLKFCKHPHRRICTWNPSYVCTQREKMLNSLVFAPAVLCQTKYCLKIDTDTMAMFPGDWLCDSWFKSNPAIVSQRWTYTKPPEMMTALDTWATTVDELKDTPPLKYTMHEKRATYRRIISWVCFLRTDWLRWAANLCNNWRLPAPSHDTFCHYVASRHGDIWKTVDMKKVGWKHFGGKVRKMREAIA